MLAKDIMTKDVITVTGDESLQNVAKIFVEKNISGLPVVDEHNRVIGVISEGDLVYQQKPLAQPMFINLFDGILQIDRKEFEEEINKIAAYEVDQLMTKHVITAHEDTPVEEIATLMINKKINRLPIVDDEGRLQGLVTRQDIIRSVYL